MPEESFEQQARNMAEQFSMEPQPVVWQRVEAAIAPKRRRRAAFVWWLLPLCVAMGLGFWLMKNNKTVLQTKAFAKPTTAAKLKILEQNKNEKADKKSTQKSSENKNAVIRKPVPVTITKADFFVNNKKSQTKQLGAKNKTEMVPIQLQSTSFAGKDGNEKEVQNKNEATSIQPQTNFFIDKNAVVDSLKTVLQNDVKNKIDTAKANATIAIKPTDSVEQNKDSSVAIINKKQRNNKWQMGLVAQAGASWLGNGLFVNKSKMDYIVSSNPSAGSGTGAVTTSVYQHPKSGADAALGVAVQRNISKRLFFDGKLLYRYQQFSIQTTTATNSQSVFNGNSVSSNANYRLQFANLYAGIGFSFLQKKNSSVALQAGIDNGWLLLVKQKQNDSLEILTRQGFQRWQPLVNVAIPVRFYDHNATRWQLSPFVRWSLRNLQKSNASSLHRPLNSAGIQVIYFFK